MSDLVRRRRVREIVGEPAKSENLSKPKNSRVLEMTKALRHEYEAVQDLTILFNRFAKHTTVGSPDDNAQAKSLRMEATVLAAELKHTVPTVTYDWLCKILHDEHLENLKKQEENREKMFQHFKNM
jgi:hypothetical protein